MVNERHRFGVFSLYLTYSVRPTIHGKKYDILRAIGNGGNGMKKKYMIMIFIIILVSAFMLSGCQLFSNRYEEGDEIIEEWLVENIQEVDAYQFKLTVDIYCDEPNVVDGEVDNSVFPSDIPSSTTENYKVTVLKADKKIKIELIDRDYYYIQTMTNINETYTNIAYYLSVEDDTVYLYSPDGSGSYTVQSYQDQLTADAVSALFFPEDVTFLQGEVLEAVFSDENDPYLNLERYIDSESFYLPFQLMLNDQKEMPKLYMNFGLSKGETYEENGFFISGIMMNDLYAYAYEAFAGEAYTNDFIRDGYKYEITFRLKFKDNRFEVEDFELPNVE